MSIVRKTWLVFACNFFYDFFGLFNQIVCPTDEFFGSGFSCLKIPTSFLNFLSSPFGSFTACTAFS